MIQLATKPAVNRWGFETTANIALGFLFVNQVVMNHKFITRPISCPGDSLAPVLAEKPNCR